MQNCFVPARILLPAGGTPLNPWACIAVDQFTSQPEYWEKAESLAAGKPSTLHLVLPEAYLGTGQEDARLASIRAAMEDYRLHLLTRQVNGYVYLERTQMDGTIRQGLVGAVDLEQYSFAPGSKPAIRPSESTVVARIPPRLKIRRGATLETPHVMMLADDESRTLVEPIGAVKDRLPLLYEGDLMLGGGHLAGWAVEDPALIAQINAAVTALGDPDAFAARWPGAAGQPAMALAVGDGNHSLATAKQCYEDLKKVTPESEWASLPARYALVEVVNNHDDALKFEPIHRVLFGVEPEKVLEAFKAFYPGAHEGEGEGHTIAYTYEGHTGYITVPDPKVQLAVGTLQAFIDEYLKTNSGEVDYIHGDEVTDELGGKPGNIGFKLPAMGKEQLFKTVMADGVLPRKTFSMGHAQDKRYYVEARKIR